MESGKPRILLCGELLSPNLGDQAIAVGIRALVSSAFPTCTLCELDLSGRQACTTGQTASTRPARSLLTRLRRGSATIRRLLNAMIWLVRSRWHFLPLARRALQRADLLIIGGGQLIADNDWMFPLRLAALTREAHRQRIATIVFGCGVGPPRSLVGSALLRRALSRVRAVVVRDEDSLERLANFGVPSDRATLGFDPAVLCTEVVRERAGSARASVGVGILSPDVLARHAGAGRAWAWWADFWTQLVAGLQGRGEPCVLFTNGDPEDLPIARLIQGRLRSMGIDVALDHPVSVENLVERIAECKAIIAHRLHASIIAFAAGTPGVGLQWDSKLAAFYERLDRIELCADAARLSVEELIALVGDATHRHWPPGSLEAAREQVRRSFACATMFLISESTRT